MINLMMYQQLMRKLVTLCRKSILKIAKERPFKFNYLFANCHNKGNKKNRCCGGRIAMCQNETQ